MLFGMFLNKRTDRGRERCPYHQYSSRVRESKTVLGSGFHAVDSGFRVQDSGFFLSGTWIPDSSSRIADTIV